MMADNRQEKYNVECIYLHCLTCICNALCNSDKLQDAYYFKTVCETGNHKAFLKAGMREDPASWEEKQPSVK